MLSAKTNHLQQVNYAGAVRHQLGGNEGQPTPGSPSRALSRPAPEPATGNLHTEDYFLDIYLRKHDPGADLKLTYEEMERLVFQTIGIPRTVVTGISQGDLRYVELRLNTNLEPWQNMAPHWVKTGITTT